MCWADLQKVLGGGCNVAACTIQPISMLQHAAFSHPSCQGSLTHWGRQALHPTPGGCASLMHVLMHKLVSYLGFGF